MIVQWILHSSSVQKSKSPLQNKHHTLWLCLHYNHHHGHLHDHQHDDHQAHKKQHGPVQPLPWPSPLWRTPLLPLSQLVLRPGNGICLHFLMIGYGWYKVRVDNDTLMKKSTSASASSTVLLFSASAIFSKRYFSASAGARIWQRDSLNIKTWP